MKSLISAAIATAVSISGGLSRAVLQVPTMPQRNAYRRARHNKYSPHKGNSTEIIAHNAAIDAAKAEKEQNRSGRSKPRKNTLRKQKAEHLLARA